MRAWLEIGAPGAKRPAATGSRSASGPDILAANVDLRDKDVRLILAVLGMTPALFDGAGAALREAYRSYYTTTLKPIAALFQAELRVKLEQPGFTIAFPDIAQGDIAARSRAVGTLVTAGAPLNEALAIVGLPTVTAPVAPEPPEVPGA